MAITEAEFWSKDGYRIRYVEDGVEKFLKGFDGPERERVLAAIPTPAAFTPRPGKVPPQVTRHKFKKALKSLGRLNAIRGFYNRMSEDAQLEWDDALEIPRQGTLVAEIAAEFSLSEQEIDQIFRTAKEEV